MLHNKMRTDSRALSEKGLQSHNSFPALIHLKLNVRIFVRFFISEISLGELNKGCRKKLGDLRDVFLVGRVGKCFCFCLPLGSIAIYGYYCFGKQQEFLGCFLPASPVRAGGGDQEE